MELPVDGKITQYFDTPVDYFKDRTTHEAIDIVTNGSQPIKMVADCEVIKVIDKYGESPNSGFGNELWVQYEDGTQDRFCHCAKGSIVAVGTTLLKGATGAKTGRTGFRSPATVIHVHWERYRSGKRIDPLSNPINDYTQQDMDKLDQYISQTDGRLDIIEDVLRSIQSAITKRASKNRVRRIEKKVKKFKKVK